MIILLCVYIYVYIYSSCHLIVGVFAHKMHSTSEFAMTVLSKQVCDSAVCAQELCTNYGLLKKIPPVSLPFLNPWDSPNVFGDVSIACERRITQPGVSDTDLHLHEMQPKQTPLLKYRFSLHTYHYPTLLSTKLQWVPIPDGPSQCPFLADYPVF